MKLFVACALLCVALASASDKAEKKEYGYEKKYVKEDDGYGHGPDKAYGYEKEYGYESKDKPEPYKPAPAPYKPDHDNYYGKQHTYHGLYKGKCDNDGFYYKDYSTFVICSNNNAYEQACAPGSRNSAHDAYNYGGNYYYRDFCDINLVDFGYGTKGYYGYDDARPYPAPYYNGGYKSGYYPYDRKPYYNGPHYYGGKPGFY